MASFPGSIGKDSFLVGPTKVGLTLPPSPILALGKLPLTSLNEAPGLAVHPALVGAGNPVGKS